MCSARRASQLLLEQVFERRTRVIGAQAGGRGRFFLPSHANFVEAAIVFRVFLRDPLLDRLHAFEAASRIEVHALFTGVKLKAALRTFSVGSHALQDGTALSTSRDGACAGHVHRARTKRIVPFRRRSPGFWSGTLTVVVPILISRLTVFRHKAPPQARGLYCVPDSAFGTSIRAFR